MMLAAALALSVAGHLHPESQASRYRSPPWTITVTRDRFTGKVACAIAAPGVRYRSGVLIFRLARRGDTTHAAFRLGGGPARPVSVAFDEDEKLGVFPERGWILDPNGGEVALPPAYAAGGNVLRIQMAPGQRPRAFRVARFTEALAAAKAQGCPA